MDINKQVLKWLGNKSFWLLKVIARYFSQNYFENAAHIYFLLLVPFKSEIKMS